MGTKTFRRAVYRAALFTAVLAIAFVVLFMLTTRVNAAQYVFGGNMSSLATNPPASTNLGPLQVGTVPLPYGNYYVQHGAMSNTNDMKFVLLMSVVSTNGGFATVPIATWYPSATNATTEQAALTTTNPPVFFSAYLTNQGTNTVSFTVTVVQ